MNNLRTISSDSLKKNLRTISSDSLKKNLTNSNAVLSPPVDEIQPIIPNNPTAPKRYTPVEELDFDEDNNIVSTKNEVDVSDTRAAWEIINNPKNEKEKLNFFPNMAPTRGEYSKVEVEKLQKSVASFKRIAFGLCLTAIDQKVHIASRYITQGCCQIDGVTLTSSYDNEGGYSIVDFMDNDGHQKTLFLTNDCHVGGLYYSENFNMLYITQFANGDAGNEKPTIACYDIDYVASLSDNDSMNRYKVIELPEQSNLEHASYLTVSGNYLYVGDHYKKIVEKYELINGGAEVRYIGSYAAPKDTQGMCVFDYNGKEYYVFSCSYGRVYDSDLIIMTFDGNNFQEERRMTLPCLSQQVSVDKDGNLMVVFENDAEKYQYGVDSEGNDWHSKDVVSFVCRLNLDKIMNN